MLHTHHTLLYSVYQYYCTRGATHDGHCIGILGFFEFLRDVDIVDDASKCRRALMSSHSTELTSCI